MSNSRQTILVVGSTGAQGGSVARHLLKSGKFNVRALTRDKTKPSAQALAALGAELVEGDLSNKDSLTKALQGVYGVFGVTNFWELVMKGDALAEEIQQGKNLADAAKEANVKHIVFSSLEDVDKLTNGRIKVPHFDGKGRIAEYMKQQGLPLTEVLVAMYADNFATMMKFRRAEDGIYDVVLPLDSKPLDLVAIEDLGGVVSAIFENPQQWIGKSLGVAGHTLTGQEIAETVTRVTGKQTRYSPVPVEVYKQFPFPGAEEVANMFQFYQDFAGKIRDVQTSKKLYPDIQSFESFVKKTGDNLFA